MKKGITSHTIIRNENRYIWFSLMSVINFVDHMIVYDTGSTDNTVDIISQIRNPKLEFEQKGEKNSSELIDLRQEQLNKTTTQWFLVLDGDEIWWKESIQKVRKTIQEVEEKIWGIITPTINCVGDIFHYQEERAGKYHFADKVGHFALRATRRTIPGIHLTGNYPLEGYEEASGKLITDFDNKLIFIDAPYLHLTNLSRSTNSTSIISREKKFELGIPFDKDFKYPEVMYQTLPPGVPSPWRKQSFPETLRSTIETPFKRFKRRIF